MPFAKRVVRQYTVRPRCCDFKRRLEAEEVGTRGPRVPGMDGRAELRARLSRPIAPGDRQSESVDQVVGYAALLQA